MYCLWVFIIGIVENFLLALNTKFLQRNRKLYCFTTSFIYVIIWFTVIAIAVDNIHNWIMKLSYAFGFASGDVGGIIFNNYLEKIAKSKGLKLKVKRNVKRKSKKR